jgi:hypothetical protein
LAAHGESGIAEPPGEKQKGRTFVRPRGDEVKYAFTKGAQKGDATNLGSLCEPRRKQNLYANPKRTAKFSTNINSDAADGKRFKHFSKSFPPRTFLTYLNNCLVTS